MAFGRRSAEQKVGWHGPISEEWGDRRGRTSGYAAPVQWQLRLHVLRQSQFLLGLVRQAVANRLAGSRTLPGYNEREREREREGKRGRRRIEGHTAVCCPADGLSVLAPCCLTWWCMHLVERPTFSFPIYRFFLSPSFSLSLSLAVIIFIQIYAQRYRNDT